jgi:hypothetical protein
MGWPSLRLCMKHLGMADPGLCTGAIPATQGAHSQALSEPVGGHRAEGVASISACVSLWDLLVGD